MESERYGRGRKPQDKSGSVNGTLGMRLPGNGKVVREREGDWPPSAASAADAMSAVVPGAGTPPKVSKMS